MVFFSCGACGESLKKNQVEKHYLTKCRNCNVLSCIDCSKEFWGDDYKQHTKCISEAEKYSGKDYKPKPGANKGEARQESWINQVQQAIQNAPNNPKLKTLLHRLEEHSNIPRKKAKFENFLTNSMKIRDTQLVSKVWDLISAEMNKKQASENEQSAKESSSTEVKLSEKSSSENGDVKDNASEKTLSKREKKELRRQEQGKQEKKDKRGEESVENGHEEELSKKKKKKSKNKENEAEQEESVSKKKKKKRKRDEDETEEVDETPNKKRKSDEPEIGENEDLDETKEEEGAEPVKGKFKWEAAIIGALFAADDNTLSVKKLRKKVMAEYASREDGAGKSEEKLLAKFNKKISKNPRLKVHKDRVKLLR